MARILLSDRSDRLVGTLRQRMFHDHLGFLFRRDSLPYCLLDCGACVSRGTQLTSGRGLKIRERYVRGYAQVG